ncbi:hypothetical protein CYMTET_9923 [Cymbomonas tetramitiformis]|uniref:L-type lectin-like domain-containing protein n=1 Tax=Cymbomonas tetramitiformis TaxID=36881 RepID=A0AAE0LEN0_9CHLO|nr:hypothetical protein CYMTET_37630 [Cymbomonas tetramitiformis]KAK3282332.1 hypothetical protein CYMTET_9923 [Cymbomonas tetramitiformis]
MFAAKAYPRAREALTVLLLFSCAALVSGDDYDGDHEEHYGGDHDEDYDHGYYNHWRTEPPEKLEDLSFSSPFQAHFAYNGDRHITNWDLGGDAVVHKHFLRLAGESQSQSGWLHTELPCGRDSWNVDMNIRISGSGEMFFGDGLAFWYVDRSFHIGGSVMGSEDQWNGLAIFFDTFQNSDLGHDQPHPYIYALLNDGTKKYHHADNNHNYTHEEKIIPGNHGENSGCASDIRFYEHRDDFGVTRNFTTARITYDLAKQTLTLKLRSAGTDSWTDCISLTDVVLPKENYFALSAQTGDLVDNHDILSFTVTETVPTDEAAVSSESQKPVSAENYLEVIQSQKEEIAELKDTLSEMQHYIEYHLTDVKHNVKKQEKEKMDPSKIAELVDDATQGVSNRLSRLADEVEEATTDIENVELNIRKKGGNNTWMIPFAALVLVVIGLGFHGYRMNTQLNKYHLP